MRIRNRSQEGSVESVPKHRTTGHSPFAIRSETPTPNLAKNQAQRGSQCRCDTHFEFYATVPVRHRLRWFRLSTVFGFDSWLRSHSKLGRVGHYLRWLACRIPVSHRTHSILVRRIVLWPHREKRPFGVYAKGTVQIQQGSIATSFVHRCWLGVSDLAIAKTEGMGRGQESGECLWREDRWLRDLG